VRQVVFSLGLSAARGNSLPLVTEDASLPV
jgi:hypothetical protein